MNTTPSSREGEKKRALTQERGGRETRPGEQGDKEKRRQGDKEKRREEKRRIGDKGDKGRKKEKKEKAEKW